ncbi:MAG TPA: hypothetical protein VLH86_01970 [Patescibacteria group bacterium]|nr:hypothetical protein [Patescibacteria group bacterium]
MNENLLPIRKKLIRLALDLASEDYHIELDFSEKSLRKVDEILLTLRKQLKSTPDSEEKRLGTQGIALELCAYIVQVIENHYGEGKWERDSKEYGKETWPFTHSGVTIFPMNWCLKCIDNGRKDKVWRKYNTFVDAMKKQVDA